VATPTPTPGVQPKRGGVITQTASSNIAHWDIQVWSATPTFGRSWNNLFYNPRDQIVTCEICKEWHLENSGKTMVFTLIQGIKFHDGREMTSADVVYSLNKMMGLIDGIASTRCGVIREYIESMTTPSKYELRINLVRPSAFLPRILSTAFCAIYPEGTTRSDQQAKPIGSGPWLLTNLISGAGWTYERNPNYFKPGLPYLDKVVIQVAAEAAAHAAFVTHRVEFRGSHVKLPAGDYVDFNKLMAAGKISSRRAAAGCRPQGMLMVVSKPPFSDINVRKAANLALDRMGWSQMMYEGDQITAQLFEADSEWGRPAKEIWDVMPGWGTGAKKVQEIAQGKALLAQSGYPKGIDVDQMNQGGTTQTTMQEILQSQLAKVDIRATIKTVGGAAEADPKRANLDYFFEGARRCQVTGDPDEAIGMYWITGGSRNTQGYSNPQVDKLYPQMSAEMDPVKRAQLVRQLEDIIVVQDVAVGVMPDVSTEHFWWNRLHGADGMGLSPVYGSGFNRWEEWWIDQ
ncbi:MAG: ABC transporter substrate-binding protein, partial [Chloroflexota bacterium]